MPHSASYAGHAGYGGYGGYACHVVTVCLLHSIHDYNIYARHLKLPSPPRQENSAYFTHEDKYR
jgi:hypothetical protein